MTDNYYQILGVNENASHDEIKKAYRNLSLKFHPDKNPSPEATEKYKKINEAYDILGDEQNRKKYEMERQNPFMRMGSRGGMGGVGININEVDELFKKSVNPIIEEINNYLEQSGYKMDTFHHLRDENVEIQQLTYETNIQITKKINLEKIQGCMSAIFNNESTSLKKEMYLRFKRVSNLILPTAFKYSI
jgi:DnaJ-class molecular chaperone